MLNKNMGLNRKYGSTQSRLMKCACFLKEEIFWIENAMEKLFRCYAVENRLNPEKCNIALTDD